VVAVVSLGGEGDDLSSHVVDQTIRRGCLAVLRPQERFLLEYILDSDDINLSEIVRENPLEDVCAGVALIYSTLVADVAQTLILEQTCAVEDYQLAFAFEMRRDAYGLPHPEIYCQIFMGLDEPINLLLEPDSYFGVVLGDCSSDLRSLDRKDLSDFSYDLSPSEWGLYEAMKEDAQECVSAHGAWRIPGTFDAMYVAAMRSLAEVLVQDPDHQTSFLDFDISAHYTPQKSPLDEQTSISVTVSSPHPVRSGIPTQFGSDTTLVRCLYELQQHPSD